MDRVRVGPNVPDDTNSNKWLKRIGFPLAGVALATGAFIGYKAWHAKDTGPTHSVSGVENPGTGPEKPVEKLLTIVEPDGTEAKLSANAQELLTYGTLTKETAGQWFTGLEKFNTDFKYWKNLNYTGRPGENDTDILGNGVDSMAGLFTLFSAKDAGEKYQRAAEAGGPNGPNESFLAQLYSVAGQIEAGKTGGGLNYTFTFGTPKVHIEGDVATYVVDAHQRGSFADLDFDRLYTFEVRFVPGGSANGKPVLLAEELHSTYTDIN